VLAGVLVQARCNISMLRGIEGGDALSAPVEPVVEVNHDLRLRGERGFLDGFGRAFQQRGDVLGPVCVAQLPDGP
jgi:hypothetical protein